MQTFIDSIDLAKEKIIDSQKLVFRNNQEKSSVTNSIKKVVEVDFSSNEQLQNFNTFEHNLNDSK